MQERLDALLDARLELGDYERWLKSEHGSTGDYLFAERRARFDAAPRDKLVRPDDLSVHTTNQGIELRSVRLGGGVPVSGVSRSSADRLLSLIDGTRSVAELRLVAGSEREALDRILVGTLGSVLFAPEAVMELEQAISGTEIVRFVGTPYEIVRAYWENMAEVRRAAEALEAPLGDPLEATRWLRRLHVLALVGSGLDRYYRPASRIASRGVCPGALYEAPSERRQNGERTLLLSGPRVGASFIGGENYHALVCADDPEAFDPQRTVRDGDGLDWGSIVYGRGPEDAEDRAWFCPPRPMKQAHFEKLFEAFGAAQAGQGPASPQHRLEHLARFHYRFVRLHPFRAANQSLCMNLVNLVLNQQKGFGIPHLLLDQFALRLSETAYTRVFARAVDAHGVTGSSLERWAKLRLIKSRAYSLIDRLKSAKDADSARRLAQADPEAAALSLIRV